jgi:hypothetical protein
MESVGRSLNGAEDDQGAGTTADTELQITQYKNGYLIKGDITLHNAKLKDYATWDEQSGAWYISRRRAYEYDHHYGLRLFSK